LLAHIFASNPVGCVIIMVKQNKGYVNAEDVIRIGPFATEEIIPSSFERAVYRILFSGRDVANYERASKKMIEDGLAKIV